MLNYIYSGNNDIPNIIELFNTCFGCRIDSEAYSNVDNRYLLAYDNDTLIALTGIYTDSVYNGAEVDWTCVHPDYRGKGIITHMLQELLADVTVDVYCSCWHQSNKPRVNLHHAMDSLGFKLAIEGNKHASYLTHKACKNCCECSGMECQCSEDLYVRKAL